MNENVTGNSYCIAVKDKAKAIEKNNEAYWALVELAIEDDAEN